MTSVTSRLWAWGIAVLTSTVACGGSGGEELFTPSTVTGTGPCYGLGCNPRDASSTTTLGAGGATAGAAGARAGGAGTDGTTIGSGGANSSGPGGSTTTGGAGAGGEGTGGGTAGSADHPDVGPTPEDSAVVDAGPADVAVDRAADVVAIHDACVPSTPRTEVCDGLDNNCNGTVDEGTACPDGCLGMSRNGVGYMLCHAVAQRRSWTEGEAQCTNRNMHLARIDDAALNTWIRTQANDANYIGSIWLGGVDSNHNGTWSWGIGGVQFWMGGRNGRPVGDRYSHWELGQPLNTQIQDDCLAMGPSTDGWRDAQCSIRTAFICQGPAR
jgi:hypothetical protein